MEEEGEGLVFHVDKEKEAHIDFGLCLVGRFLTSRTIYKVSSHEGEYGSSVATRAGGDNKGNEIRIILVLVQSSSVLQI